MLLRCDGKLRKPRDTWLKNCKWMRHNNADQLVVITLFGIMYIFITPKDFRSSSLNLTMKVFYTFWDSMAVIGSVDQQEDTVFLAPKLSKVAAHLTLVEALLVFDHSAPSSWPPFPLLAFRPRTLCLSRMRMYPRLGSETRPGRIHEFVRRTIAAAATAGRRGFDHVWISTFLMCRLSVLGGDATSRILARLFLSRLYST